MANFPVATITTARVNLLKGELIVSLRVPFTPDNAAEVLQQADSLRRMFEAEHPVSFSVRPLYEQPALPLRDTAADGWRQIAESLPPVAEPDPAPEPPDPDRPTGQTLDDFLSDDAS